jgi:hypothetical protein
VQVRTLKQENKMAVEGEENAYEREVERKKKVE